MANFAIKDAMDLKITKVGESSPAVTVDFLNSCLKEILKTYLLRRKV